MKDKDHLSTLAWLLFAGILFSAVGLIGTVTTLSPGAVSFGRSLVASGALALLCLREPRAVWTGKLRGKTAIAALAQAGNWSFFFAAIQTGGMDVAILALFAYPVMTALVEPLLEKKAIRWVELAGGTLVLLGILTVTPELKLSNSTFVGILLGLISAVFLTVRNLLGKDLVPSLGAVRLNLWMCLLCIPIFFPFRLFEPVGLTFDEVWQIGTLAVLFTVIPQVIFFASLKKVSAAWASLVISSQPVFSILLKALIFGQAPDFKTIIGGCFIVGAVILVSSFPSRTLEPKTQEG